MDTFGRKMKLARTLKGMTQDKLALKMGLTQASISYVESGEKYPSAKFIKILAEVLDISVEEFAGIAEDKIEWDILIANLKKLSPEKLIKINDIVELII